MNVPIWIPVVTAVIAIVPGVLLWRAGRQDTHEQRTSKELELIITGFVSLVNELQEEAARKSEAGACQDALRQTRILR